MAWLAFGVELEVVVPGRVDAACEMPVVVWRLLAQPRELQTRMQEPHIGN